MCKEKCISGQNLGETSEIKDKRKESAEKALGEFLSALGYDWKQDPNMMDTPKRVVKMFLNETTSGTYDIEPKITSFPNQSGYKGIVVQQDIDVKSLCSHHLQPFVGKATVAYIPGETVVGLSKLNRIVEFFARRPQLQEQLTQQIHDYVNKVLPDNKGVIVMISCQHFCCGLRGVNQNSTMTTSTLSGAFETNPETRAEFYSVIK